MKKTRSVRSRKSHHTTAELGSLPNLCSLFTPWSSDQLLFSLSRDLLLMISQIKLKRYFWMHGAQRRTPWIFSAVFSLKSFEESFHLKLGLKLYHGCRSSHSVNPLLSPSGNEFTSAWKPQLLHFRFTWWYQILLIGILEKKLWDFGTSERRYHQLNPLRMTEY